MAKTRVKRGPRAVLRGFALEMADKLAEVDGEGFGMLVARSLAKMAESPPTGFLAKAFTPRMRCLDS